MWACRAFRVASNQVRTRHKRGKSTKTPRLDHRPRLADCCCNTAFTLTDRQPVSSNLISRSDSASACAEWSEGFYCRCSAGERIEYRLHRREFCELVPAVQASPWVESTFSGLWKKSIGPKKGAKRRARQPFNCVTLSD